MFFVSAIVVDFFEQERRSGEAGRARRAKGRVAGQSSDTDEQHERDGGRGGIGIERGID